MSTFLGRLAKRVQGGGSQIKPLPVTPFSPSFYASPSDQNRALEETGITTATAICDVGTLWQQCATEGREQPREYAARQGESFLSGWPRERSTPDHKENFESDAREVGLQSEVTPRHPELVEETPNQPKATERSSNQFFPAMETHTWIAPTAPTAASRRMEDFHSNASSESDSLPSVHVTIGRIEVRSVSTKDEPERTERRGARAPRVTLEEYLRRRNAGQR